MTAGAGTAALLAALLGAAACWLVLPPGTGPSVRRLSRLRPPGSGRGALTPSRPRSRAGRGRPPRGSVPALPGAVLLDLVAAVLAAGAPLAAALRIVGEAAAAHGDARAGEELLRLADRHELGLRVDDGAAPWVTALAEALLLARESGVAAAPLLTGAAAAQRRRHAADARVAAARLGVRVVLPTGLCLLPAFVLLAVVPLVLALLGVR